MRTLGTHPRRIDRLPHTILSALPGERIIHTSQLATITENCVVVPDHDRHSKSVLSAACIFRIETEKRAHPSLPAIAAGCFLIAAGAQSSKEGGGAGPYIAVLGLIAMTSYFVTRRAMVKFVLASEIIKTGFGSARDAAKVVSAVKSIQSERPGRAGMNSSCSWMRVYLAMLL